jgi:hypothetical protein
VHHYIKKVRKVQNRLIHDQKKALPYGGQKQKIHIGVHSTTEKPSITEGQEWWLLGGLGSLPQPAPKFSSLPQHF